MVLIAIDYGLGLTTMAQRNLLKLSRGNESHTGNHHGHTYETMRFMLDLPSIQTGQKVEQVKEYFSAVDNPT